MKLLILLGPNLNLTGQREKNIYGMREMSEIENDIKRYGAGRGVAVDCFQSNHEGCLIDKLQEAPSNYDGIIINAGALSHYSYALRDAIAAINLKTIEVHMSNVFAREEFRRVSVIAPVCAGVIAGFGGMVYTMAINYFLGENA
ncbi:MAG: type II 3-dehydroquinate dehydratase [Clostridia bacterium]